MKKTFKDFLKEAYIDENGELIDFEFDDDGGGYDDGDDDVYGDRDRNNTYVIILSFDDDGDEIVVDKPGSEIEIAFFRKKDGALIDNHILDLYPDIAAAAKGDWDDGSEGSLIYFGKKTLSEMKNYFRKLGFEVREA